MKKRILIIVAVLAVLLAAAGIGYKQYRDYQQETFISIDEEVLRRDVTALDYRGKPVTELEKLTELTCLEKLDLRDTGLTAAQYEMLQSSLPDCQILWSVPFQEGTLELNTTAVTVVAFSEEDISALAYLTNLETVDATGCRDYEALFALQAARPELEIIYTVGVGGEELPKTTAEITVQDADPGEISTALMYLPELTQVTFTGATPENEQMCAWKAQYPNVTFVWEFTLCGVTVSSLDTELDLSGIPMESVEEVEAALPCFYAMQRIDMSYCGIASEELDALWKRHPETRIVWTVQVGYCELRTDIVAFMPYHYGYDGFSTLDDSDTAELKYCVDIECMDMGHMDISDYSFLENMTKMKYLVLADTKGSDFSVLANLKELVFLELFMTKFDQAEVLTGLHKLEDLNIGNAAIDNIEPLLKMTWLKRLWLPATWNVWSQERTLLRDTLTNTIVMFACEGSTGGGWRESPNYYAMRDMLGMDYFVG